MEMGVNHSRSLSRSRCKVVQDLITVNTMNCLLYHFLMLIYPIFRLVQQETVKAISEKVEVDLIISYSPLIRTPPHFSLDLLPILQIVDAIKTSDGPGSSSYIAYIVQSGVSIKLSIYSLPLRFSLHLFPLNLPFPFLHISQSVTPSIASLLDIRLLAFSSSITSSTSNHSSNSRQAHFNRLRSQGSRSRSFQIKG